MAIIADGVVYEFQDQESEELLEQQKFFDADEAGTTTIKETTELGDSLGELNKDKLEPSSRMSSIDMRSRLHYTEVSAILAVDSLVSFKFLPVLCSAFTRSKKRLAVSVDGKGRNDIVDIVTGKREHDVKAAGGGIFDKARGLFSRENNKQA